MAADLAPLRFDRVARYGGNVRDVGSVVARRYRLQEVLGTGGMGTVWRATDELLDRDVALKCVEFGGLPAAEIAEARDRTLREARIAARVHHPAIVSIFDAVEDGGEPWLVLEYVPSRTLGQVLAADGPLAPPVVAGIGAAVADAVATAHAAGIVHRDVKPDNVLLAHSGAVKLTDFGVSRAVAAPVVTASGVLIGTPAYLAPETARGEGADSRSDVFALGATLLAAVTGQPPFGTGELLALLARVGRGGAEVPAAAGPLRPLLTRMLADDAAARPTAVQAAAELRTVAVPQAADRPPRTRRRWPAVTGTAVIVAAAVAAWLLLPGRTAPAPAPPSAAGIADERTADPCALLDTAVLAQFGYARIEQDYGIFTSCTASIPISTSAMHVDVRLLDAAELASDEVAGARSPDTAVVVTHPPVNGGCEHHLLLPDGHGVSIDAVPYSAGGDAPFDAVDPCAIAVAAATAAADRWNTTKDLPQRPDTADRRALSGLDACALLDRAGIDRATAAAQRPVAGDAVRGFAGWTCTWGAVRLDFVRDAPGPESSIVAGRLAMHRRDEDNCRTYLPQRSFTAPNGSARAEYVRITVIGSGAESVLCPAVDELAARVVPKLPPPS